MEGEIAAVNTPKIEKAATAAGGKRVMQCLPEDALPRLDNVVHREERVWGNKRTLIGADPFLSAHRSSGCCRGRSPDSWVRLA